MHVHILDPTDFIFLFRFTELGSPVRTHEHTNTAAEPSTSGRPFHLANMYDITPSGNIKRQTTRSNAMQNAKVTCFPDLFYIDKDGEVRPVLKNTFIAATDSNGKIIGIIFDNFVFALYNGRRNVVMLREGDLKPIPTSLEYVEQFGVNKPLETI